MEASIIVFVAATVILASMAGMSLLLVQKQHVMLVEQLRSHYKNLQERIREIRRREGLPESEACYAYMEPNYDGDEEDDGNPYKSPLGYSKEDDLPPWRP